ncbi:hypothetical protein GCM10011351_01280 [Paraliobacillus quinghaiensis]|uniref:CBS domain-containing protein n=1 Tax=Paraliobacillus quinghaiensis TaxID=470815 RepID=A0A917WPE7_9BACI|nr:CBS domain-containing protein [Paraliobacillus quinghaiensis]GGM19173.1 hypothetical protein GCM10011351_01280 [Paraliobacillus quinghaiensis]
MKNSERFIIAFNKIEKFFEKEINEKKYIPFYRSVQLLKHTNATIDRYQDDLVEYSELRNAIIHERTEAHYAIAEPHDEVVERIEKIEQELTAPKLVIPTFQKELRTMQAEDTVKDVLKVIRETDFSQFPVYRSKQFVGLVTDKGITHWLARNTNGDIDQLLLTPVMNLIEENKSVRNYEFISKEMTIYQAERIFLEQLKKYKRLDALLITEEGKEHQALLGMISTNDLIKIP